jgi:hypothetical protein
MLDEALTSSSWKAIVRLLKLGEDEELIVIVVFTESRIKQSR